ncbi:hypothetical protein AYM02_05100 [Coxiella burnetii]|nr:hypothetical protein AUR58_05690 [Coxiella burnetii]AML54695.1 hypothetical protein AYM38_05030 [Coxiella burnetii]ATN67258.1 hypothetical protein AYM17_07875 [Coxiella burnetii]ATN70586.1 hypothetical protein AYM02_05100 [Coxiella burnetii]ATN72511.1 hypothetical protein AYM11_04925 [Coxiella burnetii]
MKSRVGDPIFILGAFLIPGNKDFGFRVKMQQRGQAFDYPGCALRS